MCSPDQPSVDELFSEADARQVSLPIQFHVFGWQFGLAVWALTRSLQERDAALSRSQRKKKAALRRQQHLQGTFIAQMINSTASWYAAFACMNVASAVSLGVLLARMLRCVLGAEAKHQQHLHDVARAKQQVHDDASRAQAVETEARRHEQQGGVDCQETECSRTYC